jgi:hypothetical protein
VAGKLKRDPVVRGGIQFVVAPGWEFFLLRKLSHISYHLHNQFTWSQHVPVKEKNEKKERIHFSIRTVRTK